MAQNFISLDPYRQGRSIAGSPIHQLDARVKLPLAIAFIVTTSLTPFGAWPVYVLLLSAVFSIALLTNIGLGHIYKRTALAIPFILAAFPLVFTVPGSPLVHFSFYFIDLSISWAGIERFFSIAVKSWISVQAAVLLAATTRLPDLLLAMRSLRIPRLLVAVIGLMWRYLFLMLDETGRLLRARLSRSGTLPTPDLKFGGTVAWRAKVAGNMAGSLLVRSFERSDRVYSAMLARGYDGEIRGLATPPLNRKSWLILIIAGLLLAGILGFGLLLGA